MHNTDKWETNLQQSSAYFPQIKNKQHFEYLLIYWNVAESVNYDLTWMSVAGNKQFEGNQGR